MLRRTPSGAEERQVKLVPGTSSTERGQIPRTPSVNTQGCELLDLHSCNLGAARACARTK